MNRKQIAGISRALMGTHIGKPGPNLIAFANAGVFAQVLASPAVRNSGMFSSFTFIESAETGACDPAAIDAACDDAGWRQLCRELFSNRLGHSQKVMLLDHSGFRAYAGFRSWCRQECPPAMQFGVESWPDLCLRLALIRAIIVNADSVAADCIERAAAYLKSRLAPTTELIERLILDETPEQQRAARIDRLCRKLTNGPLTKRGLVRTMHRQDYALVEKMTAEAMHEGRIERRGDFFFQRWN